MNLKKLVCFGRAIAVSMCLGSCIGCGGQSSPLDNSSGRDGGSSVGDVLTDSSGSCKMLGLDECLAAIGRCKAVGGVRGPCNTSSQWEFLECKPDDGKLPGSSFACAMPAQRAPNSDQCWRFPDTNHPTGWVDVSCSKILGCPCPVPR